MRVMYPDKFDKKRFISNDLISAKATLVEDGSVLLSYQKFISLDETA